MVDCLPPSDATELIRLHRNALSRASSPTATSVGSDGRESEFMHFGNKDLLEGRSSLLSRLIGEIEGHMKKVELILFPVIRKGDGPGIGNPIAAMRADHDDHDRAVEQVCRLTRDMSLPEGACGTWIRLCVGLDDFIEDLLEHIRLENEVFFPKFEPSARAGV